MTRRTAELWLTAHSVLLPHVHGKVQTAADRSAFLHWSHTALQWSCGGPARPSSGPPADPHGPPVVLQRTRPHGPPVVLRRTRTALQWSTRPSVGGPATESVQRAALRWPGVSALLPAPATSVPDSVRPAGAAGPTSHVSFYRLTKLFVSMYFLCELVVAKPRVSRRLVSCSISDLRPSVTAG